MKLAILAGGREVVLELRDRRSVPDCLKLCAALGLPPEKWRIIPDGERDGGAEDVRGAVS